MTPVVMALVFGIIEMGFVFKDYLAVSGAVRAGARVASATPRNAGFAQAAADKVATIGGAMNLNDVGVGDLWVYKVDPQLAQGGTGTDKPVGFTSFSGCTTCVKFTWNAATRHFDVASDNWAYTTQNACTSGSGGPPDRIGVYMKLKHDPFTGFVFQTVYIAEASILTLEPMPVSAVCK